MGKQEITKDKDGLRPTHWPTGIVHQPFLDGTIENTLIEMKKNAEATTP